MTLSRVIAGAALGLSLLVATAPVASAQDKTIKAAIIARQSMMRLNVFNIGPLVGMAKGEVPYDAAAASAAAASLSLLQQLDQSRFWPKGSDNAAAEQTRALPAIWSKYPDVITKAEAAADAAKALEAAAGIDLASLRAAIGPMGKACGACHKAYREPDKK